MPKSLIIVESPAKARTIEKLLGRRYTVKASMGHVRDLPKSQLGVEITNGFEPRYITIRGKGEVLKELRASARKAARVLIATDPDREGEAISWHLAEVLGLDGDEPCRIEFNEVTRDAVQRAVRHPRPIDRRRVDAQQARRVLDRLVGYQLSPLLWRKIRRGLSAGRVQSVAVRLVVDREREIEAFVPEEYWTIEVRLAPAGQVSTGPTGPTGPTFGGYPGYPGYPGCGEARPAVAARYYGPAGAERAAELRNEADVQAVVRAVEGRPFVVEAVRRRERKRQPPLPFTTSALQQEAARKLNFSVRKTMVVAQQLYEGLDLGPEGTTGLITYIRTDSHRVSTEAVRSARVLVAERFGSEAVGGAPGEGGAGGRPAAPPGAQDAHEAIRPTDVRREPAAVRDRLTPDQYRLYKLVWDRFLASQMAPAVYDVVSADIRGGDRLFRVTGSVLRVPGYRVVYEEGQEEPAPGEDGEGPLPELHEGQRLELVELVPRQHFTEPPPRYTEASLVRALEEQGIGRPSTYAPIIETILSRGYVERDGRRLRPTELGTIVVDLLREHFPKIVDVEFTARMEGQLDAVEAGKAGWRDLIRRFYQGFARDLEAADAAIGRVELPDPPAGVRCEECGREMVVKYGRYGRFLACPGFPECRNTKPYAEPLDVPCPECGALLVERRSKRGRRFYGCSRYPQCAFVSWQRPTGRRCPDCGAFLVERRGRGGRGGQGRGPVLVCVRKDCDYTDVPEAEYAGVPVG